MASAIICVSITWAEAKILKENEMDSLNFKGFHAQLDCKLTYSKINQTQLTLIQYINFTFVFKNKTEQNSNDEEYS